MMSEEDFRVHFPENRGLFSFYTLKKVLSALCALVIIALFVIIGVRSCSMKGSREMQSYLWTAEAFAAASEDDFRIYSIPAINEPSVEATFTLSCVYYTEPIEQIQFLLTYNTSALKTLAEKYHMASVPSDGDAVFAFALEDSSGNRYTEYEYVTDKQFVNGFYRLVFSGVALTEDVSTGGVPSETTQDQTASAAGATVRVPIEKLRICVYYRGEVDFEGEKLDELTLYEYGFYREEVEPKMPDAPRDDLQTGCTVENVLPADGAESKREEQES